MASQSLTEEQLLKNFNVPFDAKARKRLEYFWRGHGKGCLSRSPIYDRLNETMTKIAFQRKYPRIRDYLEDAAPLTTEGVDADSQDPKLGGLTGGKKWAHLLFQDLMQEHWIDQIAGESKFMQITVSIVGSW